MCVEQEEKQIAHVFCFPVPVSFSQITSETQERGIYCHPSSSDQETGVGRDAGQISRER